MSQPLVAVNISGARQSPAVSGLQGIRVLMYHRVVPADDEAAHEERTISVVDFRRHLDLIERWGYTPITFADYLLIRNGELSPPRKPIIITFDDGYADIYTVALPVLQEFGMKAVVFVTAEPGLTVNRWDVGGTTPLNDLMNEQQILQLHDVGFEIGSHSMTHPNLSQLPRDQAWEEILRSRMRLEILLNGPVRTFAYPYGLHNETIRELVVQAGYQFACSAWTGPMRFETDPYDIRRLEVSDATNPVRFWIMVNGPYPLYRTLTGRSSSFRVSLKHRKHVSQIKTLLLVSSGLKWPEKEEMIRREENDESPRISLLPATLNADVLDEKYLMQAPVTRRALYQFLPVTAAQLIEAFIVRRKYDAIISWAEHLGLPIATFMLWTGTRMAHIGIFSWISKPKKAILLRLARSRLNRIVLMSSVQKDYAVRRLGVPESAVAFLRWSVDQKFWRPMDCGPQDMICAVGREMRDYGTLVDALRGSSVRCHIAAGGQGTHMKNDSWVDALTGPNPLPPNVSVGPLNFLDLRKLYARSRFVIMPLLPTRTDNGTTSILEAMAMGKAVICSRVDGQTDVIRDGETGFYVPPGDTEALRSAIEHLWSHPDIAERMGKAARLHVEKHHTLDEWVRRVRQAVEESVEENAKRKKQWKKQE